MDEPIDRACAIAGSQAALAQRLGIRSPSISEWRIRGRVPVARCLEIEAATAAAVTRYELRPDIYGPAPAEPANNKEAA